MTRRLAEYTPGRTITAFTNAGVDRVHGPVVGAGARLAHHPPVTLVSLLQSSNPFFETDCVVKGAQVVYPRLGVAASMLEPAPAFDVRVCLVTPNGVDESLEFR